mmetsp:Transcript_111757/g.312393  ORF Transcript_111757/g.312393 Transcript_111757/m.312393 type:complete len:171 (+) Transcript_111757:159-671(+)
MFRFIAMQFVMSAFVAESMRSSPYEKDGRSPPVPAAVAAQPRAGVDGVAGQTDTQRRPEAQTAPVALAAPETASVALASTAAAVDVGGRTGRTDSVRAVMRGVAALAAVCSLVVAMWRSASAAQVALRDTAPGRSPVLQPGPHTTVPAPAAHRAEENVAPGREPFIKVDE